MVAITGVGGISLACGGGLPCGPLPAADRSCIIERQCSLVMNNDPCGLNGYACEDGEWREQFTYCNPPPLPIEEPLTASVEDCGHIQVDQPCRSGEQCTLSPTPECGLVGYILSLIHI